MEIMLSTREYRTANSIADFLDFYYSLHLDHLASDLLEKGLTPNQINDAITKAMNAGKSSGIDLRKHFMPVFSGTDKEIIRDCKLSHLGYGLVLMNADTGLPVVGDFQVTVLRNYLRDL